MSWISCIRLRLYLAAGRRFLPQRVNKSEGDVVEIGIYRRGGIGDWAIFQDALEHYAQIFPAPRHRLTIFGDVRFEDFDFLARVPHRFVGIDQKRLRRSWRARFDLLCNVRRTGYSIWIDADVSANKMGLLLAIAAAAPRSICCVEENIEKCPGAGRNLQDKLFTETLSPEAADQHERWRVQRIPQVLASQCGLTLRDPEPRRPLARPCAQPYIAIFVGASESTRRWPLSRYAEAVRVVCEANHLIPVFLGEASAHALEAIPLPANLLEFDLRGRTTAQELVTWIANAKVVLSNDSAAVHIARLFGRKVVIVAPGAHWTRYLDYRSPLVRGVHAKDTRCFNCAWQCHRPRSAEGLAACVDEIATHDVVIALKEMIALAAAPVTRER